MIKKTTSKKKTAKKKITAKKRVVKKKVVNKLWKPPANGKVGRDTAFFPELGVEICIRMMAGQSLRKVCEADDMPDKATVFRWLVKGDQDDADPEFKIFRDQYTRSTKLRREYRFEELEEELTDHASSSVLLDKRGNVILLDGKPVMGMTGPSVQYARMMLDAFKWQSSKEEPKKYGDKVNLDHGLQPDNPINELLGQLSGNALPVRHDNEEGE